MCAESRAGTSAHGYQQPRIVRRTRRRHARPRYAEPTTFARLPRLDEVSRADVTILGIPFDSGVSYRPGARFGPGHIRAASKLLRPYNPALKVSPLPTSR
ncbi:hypothetical protein GCM10020255_047870 [Rhodococcus baikonurensis]